MKLSHGFTWLKVRFFLTKSGKVVKKIYKRSVTRMRVKLKKLKKRLSEGLLLPSDVYQTWQSWRAYAMKFNAYNTVNSMAELVKQLFYQPIRRENYGLS